MQPIVSFLLLLFFSRMKISKNDDDHSYIQIPKRLLSPRSDDKQIKHCVILLRVFTVGISPL